MMKGRLLLCLVFGLGLLQVVRAQSYRQFQIVDKAGESVAGAHVLIGNEVYFSDEAGHVRINNHVPMVSDVDVSALGYKSTKIQLADLVGLSTLVLETSEYNLTGVEVLATSWVEADEPFTAVIMTRQEIESINLGQDIPTLLQGQPSLTYTSDAGNGIGYSSFRIRGTDPTRINIAIDGIPLNEAESQGVFWVDLPDFASSTDRIQVQRGVGPSTNGTGVFGATVNLITEKYQEERALEAGISLGSFNSQKYNVKYASGRFLKDLSFVGRASYIHSDGFIDRASSDLYSLFGSLSKSTEKSFTNLKVFYGLEETYQAWNGVPYQYVHELNRRTFNTAGEISANQYYDNQIDHYGQTHVHLIHDQRLDGQWSLSLKGHYTDGGGYFEEYELAEDLADYGFASEESSDLVRRRWLGTDYAGLIANAHWETSAITEWRFGMSGTYYEGDHWGEVIRLVEEHNQILPHEYYRNDAFKRDFAAFVILKQDLSEYIGAYVDLQYRWVDYRFEGHATDGELIDRKKTHRFLNPKFGVNYTPKHNWRLYVSAAYAQKEPNRNDYVEAVEGEDPRPESLLDIELGSSWQQQRWQFQSNLYGMFYKDQLVLTGELNNVGENVRTNAENSYRLGMELSGHYAVDDTWSIEANLALSNNRIKKFREYVDNWDTGEQEVIDHRNTYLSFSPSVVSFLGLQHGLTLGEGNRWTNRLTYKYVGKQYLDNSSSETRALDGYGVLNLNGSFELETNMLKGLVVKYMINNLLDNNYVSNGWSYHFRSPSYNPVSDDPAAVRLDESDYALIGLFPQAGINFMVGVNISL